MERMTALYASFQFSLDQPGSLEQLDSMLRSEFLLWLTGQMDATSLFQTVLGGPSRPMDVKETTEAPPVLPDFDLALSADPEDAVTMEPIEGRPVFLVPELSDKGEIRHLYNSSTLCHLRRLSPFSRAPLSQHDYRYVPRSLWPEAEA